MLTRYSSKVTHESSCSLSRCVTSSKLSALSAFTIMKESSIGLISTLMSAVDAREYRKGAAVGESPTLTQMYSPYLHLTGSRKSAPARLSR